MVFKDFDTKIDNKNGLFQTLVPDKINSLKNEKTEEFRKDLTHLPSLPHPNAARMIAYRKAVNNNVVQSLGLKALIPYE
jgi:hypothetical protein